MPCCIIAAALILRFVFKWDRIKIFLGIQAEKKNPYGWEEYCELDEYSS